MFAKFESKLAQIKGVLEQKVDRGHAVWSVTRTLPPRLDVDLFAGDEQARVWAVAEGYSDAHIEIVVGLHREQNERRQQGIVEKMRLSCLWSGDLLFTEQTYETSQGEPLPFEIVEQMLFTPDEIVLLTPLLSDDGEEVVGRERTLLKPEDEGRGPFSVFTDQIALGVKPLSHLFRGGQFTSSLTEDFIVLEHRLEDFPGGDGHRVRAELNIETLQPERLTLTDLNEVTYVETSIEWNVEFCGALPVRVTRRAMAESGEWIGDEEWRLQSFRNGPEIEADLAAAA